MLLATEQCCIMALMGGRGSGASLTDEFCPWSPPELFFSSVMGSCFYVYVPVFLMKTTRLFLC